MWWSKGKVLVANQSKTEFLVLNKKDKTSRVLSSITVGRVIVNRTTSTKLLGVFIEESQEWEEQLRRLNNSLNLFLSPMFTVTTVWSTGETGDICSVLIELNEFPRQGRLLDLYLNSIETNMQVMFVGIYEKKIDSYLRFKKISSTKRVKLPTIYNFCKII